MAETRKTGQSKKTQARPSTVKKSGNLGGRSKNSFAAAAKAAKSASGKPVKTVKNSSRQSAASRKSKSRKGSGFNLPLLMALLALLALGGGGVYWLFKTYSAEINSSQTAAQLETNQQEQGENPQGTLNEQSASGQAKPAQGKSTGNPSERAEFQKRSSPAVQAAVKPDFQNVLPKPEPIVPESVAPETMPPLGEASPLKSAPPGGGIPAGQSPQIADAGVKGAFRQESPGIMRADDFETTLGSDMEQNTKRIDAYLLGLLSAKGYSGENIEILEVERRVMPGNAYHFQKLRVKLPEGSAYYENPTDFDRDAGRGLKALQVGAALSKPAQNHYVLSIDGLVTHEIFLEFFKPASPETISTVTLGETALLAIVIDDVGESLNAAQHLASLNFPVTFAIWPRAGNARECAEIGHSRGLEIMIHQPMEPMEYPKVKPGSGAVFNSMKPGEITARVEANIPLVPYAVGLNNHMGSRFTQNREGLNAVLAAMQGFNLFVLDSVTHGSTIFYHTAKEKGFASQRRDIFLDVTRNKSAILHQLRQSERLAQAQGYAIAIGHPLPETLAALEEWQKNRNENIKIVRVQDLLQYDRGSAEEK